MWFVFKRHEPGTKCRQFSKWHRVHCSCKLSTIRHRKQPIPTLEWFSVKYRKTKTKVITLANTKNTHNTVNQSKLEVITGSWRKARETHASESRLVLVLLLSGWKIGASFFKPIMWRSKRKTNYFSTQSNENRSMCTSLCTIPTTFTQCEDDVACSRGRGEGCTRFLIEANGDVPLDGVAFSRPDWPSWGRIFNRVSKMGSHAHFLIFEVRQFVFTVSKRTRVFVL